MSESEVQQCVGRPLPLSPSFPCRCFLRLSEIRDTSHNNPSKHRIETQFSKLSHKSMNVSIESFAEVADN